MEPENTIQKAFSHCMMLSTDTQFLGGSPRDFVGRKSSQDGRGQARIPLIGVDSERKQNSRLSAGMPMAQKGIQHKNLQTAVVGC